MNIDQASELLLSIDGMTRVLHTTKTATFDRWQVGDVVIAWHRPLNKKDLAALGARVSAGVARGDVLAMHVTDLGEKQAWLQAAPGTCFDTPHFKNYPAVLINLEHADPQVLLEIAETYASHSD